MNLFIGNKLCHSQTHLTILNFEYVDNMRFYNYSLFSNLFFIPFHASALVLNLFEIILGNLCAATVERKKNEQK